MSTAATAPEPPTTDLPFRDPALPLARRVDDLISRLTLDERIELLYQYSPGVPRLGLASFKTGTEGLHGVSWLGPATVFPQAVGLGATWDEELLHEVATAVGTEARAFHERPSGDGYPHSLQIWAPVVNLLRDPRWGRNEEGYAEDPLLTGRLSVSYCRGLAGDHPVHLRTAPLLKHFLAYNNEDERDLTSSVVPPRVLHEYDLAAFRPAIESGAATGVMPAYNLINGRPCHVSPLLETEVRRWAQTTGHELFVCSDAGAVTNLTESEHYFDDHPTSHAAAVRAGVDNITEQREDGSITLGRLRTAVDRGLLTEADIDRAARRHLSIRFRLGEFDPDLDPYAGIRDDVVDSPEHRALALRAATESVVLLKNDGALPLSTAPGRRVALVGPLADTLFEDWYSGTMPYRITVATGLETALKEGGAELVCAEGVDRITLRAASTGGLLRVPAFDPGGPMVAGASTDEQECGDSACHDLFDWGEGVLTLRNARTERYVTLKDGDLTLAADQTQPNGWFVHETFRLELQPDGTELLRNISNGRYAALDPATGRVTLCAEAPEKAERWTRTAVRDGIAEAVAAAASADVAVVVLGNDPHINGRETEDRSGISLPPAQEALLRAVATERPEAVLVVMSSYPYAVDWADKHLPAVVWTSHGGQETGRALAAILLGEAEPSGRLPQTWYRGDDPLPGRLDYDIISAGWTYQYHDAAPLYPFGHGLTYTTFSHSQLRLSAREAAQDDTLTVSVELTNTGTRPGTETVQLYTRAVAARHRAPRRRLTDFRKVSLAPGERRRLEFDMPVAALAHWSVSAGAFAVDPGRYEIQIGHSSEAIALTAPLTVTGPALPARSLSGGRLEAVDFDECVGGTLVDATREKGEAVTPATGHIHCGLRYRSVDLGGTPDGPRVITAEVSRATEEDATVEIYADGGPGTGTLLAVLDVPAGTHGRYDWRTVSAPMPAEVTGVHDLHLVLRGGVHLAAIAGGTRPLPPRSQLPEH
ncbi:glycoside hydrolase family 3 protein [Streptomyces sp. TLI_185]|uniref:glycoside hydrolase family 3 protein n=1 Tax=Streptomyces sp. TLI_185 TaxID=2485151 RepID=UPI000F50AE54|nr:glycoside hydrolase family 3 protein [Streptomyces sp. TLI_185]